MFSRIFIVRSVLRQSVLSFISASFFFMALLFAPAAWAVGSGQKTLILPHVEASGGMMTGLSLLNRGDVSVEVTLTPYGSDGSVLGPGVKIEMGPRASYLGSLSRVLGAGPSLSWVKLVSTGRVTGFAMIGNENRITRVELESRASRVLTLPYLISRDDIYTSLHILNAGSAPAEIVIRSFSSGGVELGVVLLSRLLKPGEKLTGTVRGIMGSGEAAVNASWITVSSDQPLIGVALIGAPGRLFSVPME